MLIVPDEIVCSKLGGVTIKTEYLKIDPIKPEPDLISQAAAYIKAGELVAFPTETVYGLGADALQPTAIAKIFIAKGRPQENALLVHVSNMEQVESLVTEVTPKAIKLMKEFWPGPLSIILRAHPAVPTLVRGGRPGVGLRMPSHPVALALIEGTGPLAAPSANLYGRPSPTNALHVRQDLDGKIAAVLDAGNTGSGLESTIIDLTDERCRIIRRGGLKIEFIEECLGQRIEVDQSFIRAGYQSPVKIILTADEEDFERRLAEVSKHGTEIGIVFFDKIFGDRYSKIEKRFRLDLTGQGSSLYGIIRESEAAAITVLLFEPFDPCKIGDAWVDRLHRAAST